MPLSITNKVWDSISMDMITRLPVTARGFDAILVVVDIFYFLQTKSSSEYIAQLLWSGVFCLVSWFVMLTPISETPDRMDM